MTSKHTPGPWSIERAPGLITIGGEGAGNIAHVLRGLDCAQDANAQLIAQAPAMLEALRGLCSLVESWDDAETYNSPSAIEARSILSRIDGKE